MVDHPEEGVADNRTVMEHFCEAPQKISSYISETTKTYMARVLGLFKSFWPNANLVSLADGMAADCSKEKFADYIEVVG
jgi:hypothetical protein